MKSMSYRITKINVAQGIVQNLIVKLVSIPLPFSELIFKKESLLCRVLERPFQRIGRIR